MDKSAEQIIVDILVKWMKLDSQRVWVFDQSVKFPADQELFIQVGAMGVPRVLSTSKQDTPYTIERPDPQPDIETLKESITVVAEEFIQIDLCSRNTDARNRRYEVLQALASTYSIQQQEKYNFKIFRQPSTFVNASGAEGGSTLNRFSITIACHVWYRDERVLKQTDIFDDFESRVDDRNTISEPDGLFEFTIDENTTELSAN